MGPKPQPPTERFWPKVQKTDSCWMWTGGTNPHGYGRFWNGQRLVYAHRFVYELLVGPIPAGLDLDHLCRVHGCVNPEHLEPVTRRENAWRGLHGFLTTECSKGHAYDEGNTGWSRGWRYCKICNRAKVAYYANLKKVSA